MIRIILYTSHHGCTFCDYTLDITPLLSKLMKWKDSNSSPIKKIFKGSYRDQLSFLQEYLKNIISNDIDLTHQP